MSVRATRIEYEVPPMRAIWSTWVEEEPQFTDAEIIAAFVKQTPGRRVRKIERNVEVEPPDPSPESKP